MNTAPTLQIEPPKHLSERAQSLWREIVPRRAKSAERIALVQTALEALDRADQAREVVAAEGMTVRTEKTGTAHAHPLLKVEAESRKTFMKIWDRLDFATPIMAPIHRNPLVAGS